MEVLAFYEELKLNLPSSNGAIRKKWAQEISYHKYDFSVLSKLLLEDVKIASRFAWLLTDLGELDSGLLSKNLPYLLQLSKNITQFNFKQSFANYWLTVGVPKQNEALALGWLFTWLNAAEVNVTIKSRAIIVLFQLTTFHPEIRNELIVSIENQLNKHTSNFDKRSIKVLESLRKIEG
jgi:hypothetical protein